MPLIFGAGIALGVILYARDQCWFGLARTARHLRDDE